MHKNLCKKGFSTYDYLKSDYRHRLNAGLDLKLTLSDIESNFELFCSIKKPQTLHLEFLSLTFTLFIVIILVLLMLYLNNFFFFCKNIYSMKFCFFLYQLFIVIKVIVQLLRGSLNFSDLSRGFASEKMLRNTGLHYVVAYFIAQDCFSICFLF